jgi:hypothetical protein
MADPTRLPPPPFWRLGTYIRVVTLADGETVHNVFKDGDFVE